MTENQQNTTLEQKRFWHGSNTLSLNENRAMKIVQKRGTKNTSYMIDIIALDSKSRRVYSLAWKWLGFTLILGAMAYYSMQNPDLLASLVGENSAMITALVALLAGVFLVLFLLTSSRKQVFHTLHGKIPVVELWVGNPSGKLYKQYLKNLTTNISHAQEVAGLSEEQQMTGEIKMLRRLADMNVVNQKQYESVKKKLLKKM